MGFKQFIYSVGGVFMRLAGRVAPTLYLEDVSEHFERVFEIGEGEIRVFHELMSDLVHIDIHVAPPAENRPFYLLFTTGMSDLAMEISGEVTWDFKKTRERAELFCLLPPDWKFDGFSSPEEEKNFMWIISCLKTAARYPHRYDTWLGSMHSLQYSEENIPFAPNTRLSSAAFLQLDDADFGGRYGDELNFLRTGDGSYINLLCFIPIYEDEMNLKLEEGCGELFMRLFGETVTDFSQLIIDVSRKDVCLNKSI